MALKFCIVALLSIFSSARSDYVAAVVEHFSVSQETIPSEVIEDNLQEFREQLGVAKRSNADIIVFPEYGLTGIIDDPTNYSVVIPEVGTGMKNFSEYVLQSLAEAAVEHNIYIVANIAEKATNAKNKTVYYNTNIVFDRSGTLVAKYRKIHLYDEPQFTPGSPADLPKAIFTTDFGRTFGTFICFDILFYEPSRTILGLNGSSPVTDVVYPTAWYSMVPLYHSLSVQHAYAMENKVNLLAANINVVKDGQGGSGIYGADGTVYSYYITGKPTTKILISKVKTTQSLLMGLLPTGGANIIPEVNDLTDYKTPHYFKASEYKFKYLDLSKENISEKVCDGPFCCEFTLNVTTPENQTSGVYQLVAYRGPIMLGPGVNGPTKMCFLVACESRNTNTCGTRQVNSTAIFRHISVRTKVRNHLNQYYVPITLTTDLLPVFNSTYDSLINDNAQREIELATSRNQTKVLIYGIFSNGVGTISGSWSLTVFVLFTFVKYFV